MEKVILVLLAKNLNCVGEEMESITNSRVNFTMPFLNMVGIIFHPTDTSTFVNLIVR
jgi:uncharacterized membrane protein